ncbi:PH domain-containing protein [Gordonia otitidis]|uniref:PH domain-containing protein n=1 Tax=Gordonia otitidis TaxID=249058 RepID=UPI002353ACB2|nr:PH domain-containing protein [Gordonia otitidis]
MSFPRDNLAAGERVVVHHHPHWKCLIGPFSIFVLGTGLAGLAAGAIGASTIDPTLSMVLNILVAVCWAALAVWFFLRPLIGWKSTHFILTDRRVIFRRGVLTRSGIDIPVRRINTVEFRHGLLDRMLRTGTLIIESGSDEPLLFDDVPQVERVHTLLYHEVFDRPHHEVFDRPHHEVFDPHDEFDERHGFPHTGHGREADGRGRGGDSAYSRRVEVDRR